MNNYPFFNKSPNATVREETKRKFTAQLAKRRQDLLEQMERDRKCAIMVAEFMAEHGFVAE